MSTRLEMIKKETCKLYRNFNEIIHPSISRKNISEYKIIFQEEIIPVQIFYPDKEVELNHIMIYIPGSSTYYNYYENLAVQTKQVVILIDHSSKNKKEDYEKVIHYIMNEALKCKIDLQDITIISDFQGVDWILELDKNEKNKTENQIRKILLSPSEEDLTKYELPNTLVLSNNEGQKYNDMINYDLIQESIYDFMKDPNSAENDGIYLKITRFINGKED